MLNIVKKADELGEFITLSDGFVYWWPDRKVLCAISSHELRELADELDRRSAKWEKRIDEYFEGQTNDKL